MTCCAEADDKPSTSERNCAAGSPRSTATFRPWRRTSTSPALRRTKLKPRAWELIPCRREVRPTRQTLDAASRSRRDRVRTSAKHSSCSAYTSGNQLCGTWDACVCGSWVWILPRALAGRGHVRPNVFSTAVMMPEPSAKCLRACRDAESWRFGCAGVRRTAYGEVRGPYPLWDCAGRRLDRSAVRDLCEA